MAQSTIELLKSIRLSEEVLQLLDANFGVTPEENAKLVQLGFWHVAFFANARVWAGARSSWIGVRLIPNRPLDEMPVVATSRFGAITISPSLKNLIPNWLLYLRVSAGSWQSIHDEWNNVKDQLLSIHLSINGDSALFDRLEKYVLTAKNFESPKYQNEIQREHEFIHVDQSLETTQFRNFIQKLILDQLTLPELPNNFGAWNDYARSAIASRAYALRGRKQRSLPDTIQAMWSGFDKAAPYDSDLLQLRQFTMARDPTDQLRQLALAVTQPWPEEAAIPMGIQSDPLFPAARALASFDFASGYQGVEHMEAAAKLDIDFNDGQRSYEALISASFWSAMNLGFPFKESYQAGLHLAAKYGWDEMLELLEGNEFELAETRA